MAACENTAFCAFAGCGKPTTRVCPICTIVAYCSKEHQEADAENHAESCALLRKFARYHLLGERDVGMPLGTSGEPLSAPVQWLSMVPAADRTAAERMTQLWKEPAIRERMIAILAGRRGGQPMAELPRNVFGEIREQLMAVEPLVSFGMLRDNHTVEQYTLLHNGRLRIDERLKFVTPINTLDFLTKTSVLLLGPDQDQLLVRQTGALVEDSRVVRLVDAWHVPAPPPNAEPPRRPIGMHDDFALAVRFGHAVPNFPAGAQKVLQVITREALRVRMKNIDIDSFGRGDITNIQHIDATLFLLTFVGGEQLVFDVIRKSLMNMSPGVAGYEPIDGMRVWIKVAGPATVHLRYAYPPANKTFTLPFAPATEPLSNARSGLVVWPPTKDKPLAIFAPTYDPEAELKPARFLPGTESDDNLSMAPVFPSETAAVFTVGGTRVVWITRDRAGDVSFATTVVKSAVAYVGGLCRKTRRAFVECSDGDIYIVDTSTGRIDYVRKLKRIFSIMSENQDK